MRPRLTTLLAVIGAATVLVLAANSVAIAATGQGFLLGKSNTASSATTLTRTTSGPALGLKTKTGTSAPLTVNGTGLVSNLNADRLHGLTPTQLRTTSRVYRHAISSSAATKSFDLSGYPPAGQYLVDYSAFLSEVSASGGQANCYVASGGTATAYVGESSTRFNAGDNVGVSGSGLVSVSTQGDPVTLHCSASNTFITNQNEPIQMVLTPTKMTFSTDQRRR